MAKRRKKDDKYDAAVRLLMKACDGQVILAYDEAANVYVIPAIMTDDSSERLLPGAIEYQVSDDLPGHRSHSCDFDDFKEAMECYRAVVKGGWNAAMRGVPATVEFKQE